MVNVGRSGIENDRPIKTLRNIHDKLKKSSLLLSLIIAKLLNIQKKQIPAEAYLQRYS